MGVATSNELKKAIEEEILTGLKGQGVTTFRKKEPEVGMEAGSNEYISTDDR